jgi:hypothetical protein
MTILEIGISFPTKDKLSKVCRFTMATMCCDSHSYIANMLAFLLCLLVNNRRSATHQALPLLETWCQVGRKSSSMKRL